MHSRGKYGRCLPLIIGVALLLLGLRPALAQNAPLPLETYWETIAQIRDDLIAAPEADGAVREAAISTLKEMNQVKRPDGRIQLLDHTFLIRQLENEGLDQKTVATLFTAYLSSRLGWPEPHLPLLDEAALNDILNQPEFQYAPEEPNFFQRLWQNIRQAIEDFFLQLFPENSNVRFPVDNILVILAAVLVVGVLIFTVRGLIKDLTADAAYSAEEQLDGEPLTAELALQRAQELSTDGDYRTAVRYLYLSSLLLLEERGLLRYDRSLTNREYLRTVAHRPDLAAILREVIDVFDRVWYGFQGLSASEYNAYAQRVALLKQQKEGR